jgi:hypothetical protein
MRTPVCLGTAALIFAGLCGPAVSEGAAGPDVVAQAAPAPSPASTAPAGPAGAEQARKAQSGEKPIDTSPQAIMNRRFPQKVRVGDLIGLPILDDADVTLGHVLRVVRTPEGRVELIVDYSKWFGWFGRPVAVPIEVVAILARQIASLDMKPSEYAAAPTWTQGKDTTVPDNDIIRIAITRR